MVIFAGASSSTFSISPTVCRWSARAARVSPYGIPWMIPASLLKWLSMIWSILRNSVVPLFVLSQSGRIFFSLSRDALLPVCEVARPVLRVVDGVKDIVGWIESEILVADVCRGWG